MAKETLIKKLHDGVNFTEEEVHEYATLINHSNSKLEVMKLYEHVQQSMKNGTTANILAIHPLVNQSVIDAVRLSGRFATNNDTSEFENIWNDMKLGIAKELRKGHELTDADFDQNGNLYLSLVNYYKWRFVGDWKTQKCYLTQSEVDFAYWAIEAKAANDAERVEYKNKFDLFMQERVVVGDIRVGGNG